MSKRTKETITLGSGKAYYDEFSGNLPSLETICTADKMLGYVKGGAALEYTEENYTETDDLGLVKKIITTKEEAKLKLGLITWNNTVLNVMVDRSVIDTSTAGKRILKIGGANKARNQNYVICFHHEDKADGDVWIMLVGRNTAGLNLTLAADSGSKIEPEFTAIPHDSDGTLIQITEEVDIEPASDNSTNPESSNTGK